MSRVDRCDEGDETVTMQLEEQVSVTGNAGPRLDGRADAPLDYSDGTLRESANRAIVSMLVLAAAAVLIGLVTFALAQTAAAGADGTELVDTADCKVIAALSAESLDSSTCIEQVDSAFAVVGDSVQTQDASRAGRPSQVVPAAGLWIHSMLQSLG